MATICTRTRATAEAHGLARWLSRPAATTDGPARVGVLVINGVAYRLCEQLDNDGASVGWWLTRADGGGRYFVDTTFGPEPGHHSCTCPHARFRGAVCKHINSLAAALRHLEAPAAVVESNVA